MNFGLKRDIWKLLVLRSVLINHYIVTHTDKHWPLYLLFNSMKHILQVYTNTELSYPDLLQAEKNAKYRVQCTEKSIIETIS